MVKYMYRFFIELTNNLYISNILSAFTSSKWSKYLIPSFVKTYRINLQEVEKDRKEYNSLHEFFIRTLKKGARPIDGGKNIVVSPVDGFVEDAGMISKEMKITIKKQTYSIKEMLGSLYAQQKYEGGHYIVLYLSPRDYHRIHCPFAGEIVAQWELGGKSYPVNKWGLKYGHAPLAKNYRRISEVRMRNGKNFAIVKVGALLINTIKLTHKDKQVKKGEEIGYFSFGSTVVLLFEKGSFQLEQSLINRTIQMGQRIGCIS